MDEARGSDENDGSINLPYKTIQKAAKVAVAGDVVTIHGGTYRETIEPSDSGSPGKPIVFQASEGETPTTSGCERADGGGADTKAIFTGKPLRCRYTATMTT